MLSFIKTDFFPSNEKYGLVILWGRLYPLLGLKMVKCSPTFPDCIMKTPDDRVIRIELEYKASNFLLAITQPQSLEPQEKEEVSQVDLLVGALQEIAPILNRLSDSPFELTPLVDHLVEFKLLLMQALELAPQPTQRE